MQPVKHAVHGLCVGDGRPVMSHFGGVSPSHTCLTLPHAYGLQSHRLTGLFIV